MNICTTFHFKPKYVDPFLCCCCRCWNDSKLFVCSAQFRLMVAARTHQISLSYTSNNNRSQLTDIQFGIFFSSLFCFFVAHFYVALRLPPPQSFDPIDKSIVIIIYFFYFLFTEAKKQQQNIIETTKIFLSVAFVCSFVSKQLTIPRCFTKSFIYFSFFANRFKF